MFYLPIPYKDERVSNTETRIVAWLIGLNAAGFGAELFLSVVAPERLADFAFAPHKQPAWQWPVSLLTSEFMHASFGHLFGNMWALWLFGPRVEEVLGRRFLLLYFVGSWVGTAAFAWLHSGPYALLGASGAVSAVVAAYCTFFPRAKICCVSWFIIPVPHLVDIPAPVFAGAYVLVNYLSLVYGGGASNVAYAAHLGSAAFGLGYGLCSYLDVTPERAEELEVRKNQRLRGDRARKVETDWKANRADEAWEGLMRGFREDPLFSLSGPLQLEMGLRLRREGRACAARVALERLILAEPVGREAAEAWLNLAEMELASFLDPSGAAASFDRAMRHSWADAPLKDRAQAGAARAHERLAAAFQPRGGEPDRFVLVLAGAPALRPAQFAAAARLLEETEAALGARLAQIPGRLSRELPLAAAKGLARALAPLGIEVLPTPEAWLGPPPAVKWVKTLTLTHGGLLLAGEEAVEFPWDACLLVAAALVEAPWAGGQSAATIPVLEVWTRESAGRFRWVASEDYRVGADEERRFFDALQDVVLRAPPACLGSGAQAAFDRRLPDLLVAPSFGELDRLFAVPAALARLRREGRLGRMDEPPGDVPAWLSSSAVHSAL